VKVFEDFLGRFIGSNDYRGLIGSMFERFQQSQQHLKDILHLNYLFVKNRRLPKLQEDERDGYMGQKVSKVYQVVTETMPYWIQLLQVIYNDSDKVDLFEEIYLI
jgi:hypothetical protein